LAQIEPGALWNWLPYRWDSSWINRRGQSIGERFLRVDAANCGEQYRKDGAH
jgi:hypothetical protein